MAGPDRAPKPKQTDERPVRTNATVDPNVVTNGVPSAPRLTSPPNFLDVGEQVFGSDHVFNIAAPFNIGYGAGVARLIAALDSGGPFSVAQCPEALVEASSTMASADLGQQLRHPIQIRFAPVEGTPKHVNATLWITATWSDGHVEAHRVELRGRARGPNDPPDSSPTPEQAAVERSAEIQAAEQRVRDQATYDDVHAHGKTYDSVASTEFNLALQRGKDAAEDIAQAQLNAVTIVDRQIGTYRAAPAPTSIWWDIVEFALAFGTAGIAEIVSKKLALGLGRLLDGDTTKDSNGVIILAAGLKDELKAAVKGAIPAPAAYEASAAVDPRLAFFEAQLDALAKLTSRNRDVITDQGERLLPYLANQPHLAVASMTAIATALKPVAEVAKQRQQEVVSAQWLTFKARAENGTEQLADGAPVTQLAISDGFFRAKLPETEVPHTTLKGVIDIDVDMRSGQPHLARAHVRGIARLVVQHLENVALGDAHVPIRIRLGRFDAAPAVIMRDESGRVTVYGEPTQLACIAEGDDVSTRIQAEHAARRLCDLVLGKPLSEWNVRLETDDVAGGGK